MFPLFVWKLFPLFLREIKPKKLDTEPERSQLRGDFLLGRDQADASESRGKRMRPFRSWCEEVKFILVVQCRIIHLGFLLYGKYFFVKAVTFTFESYFV
ncbi:hypothetical protein YC2023_050784 [Brassica napus]